jgi:hypothetical protein
VGVLGVVRGWLAGAGAGAVLLAGAAVLAPAGQAWASTGSSLHRSPAAASSASGLVTIEVDPGFEPTGPLRAGLAGLSFPSTGLYSGNFRDAGNLPALLRDLGPGVLRFGGNSVDRASFGSISTLRVRELANLARRTGWRVLFSLNLGHFRASQVSADAHRVAAGLGPRLLAFACGNEPELYAGVYRPAGYDEADYLGADLPGCLTAVHRGAPRAPFAGPDTFEWSGGPGHWYSPWLAPFAQAAASGRVPGLSLRAAHVYPMTHCGGTPGGMPTRLLSAAAEEMERGALAAVRAAAAIAGVPYLISESNSASCEGIPGLSNAYVSALWSADWLMLAAERDASGVDFNGALSYACPLYSPLCQTGPGQYAARPVFYGMLFVRLMGTGRTFFTPLTISGSAGAHVVTHSVQSSSGVLKVMVENLGGVPMRVLLHDGRVSGRAWTWYLTGPSPGATSGVRIQGAQVRRNGSFRPGPPGHTTCRAGSCRLTLPPYTAVIVQLPR